MNLLRGAFALLAALAGLSTGPAKETSLLIRGARVFDGSGAPAIVEDVLVRGETIAAIGPHLSALPGAQIVDARGLTLIPGLHDLHTHLRSPAFDAPDDLGKAYAAYLLAGVTSVNDYSLSGEMLAPIRAMAGSGAVMAPHLELAVRLGVPGGHGTESGWGSFFTLEAATPHAAHLAMATALPYKPDIIKVFADGWRYGRDTDLNSMNEPTLAAIVEDARQAGIPVITHTVTLAGAKIAAAAGVDSVGHGVGDAPVDDDLIAQMKAHHTGYISTLVVYEPKGDRAFLPAEWQSMRPPERAREMARQAERAARPARPIPDYESRRWAILQENIRRLKAAGIRIGIGTDAGIEGVYHGSSTIREIVLLTKLGFTPAEALHAATMVSADILGQSASHGRIAPGQRADLVLIGGKPDAHIEDIYAVRRLFLSGREIALAPLRALLDGDAPSPLPVHRMAGPIDTGQGAPGRTDLDTLPVESSDTGVDHSHVDFVRPVPNAPMFLVAQMGASPRPFAQLILPLTRGAIQLADASGFTGIAFEARGTGRYMLRLDSYGFDEDAAFRAPFAAGDGGQELRIPFSDFRSPDGTARLDLTKLRALIVRLEGEPGGKAWLALGKVRFYR